MRSKQWLALVIGGGAVLASVVGFRSYTDRDHLTPQAMQMMPAVPGAMNRATYTNPVIDQNFPDPSILKDKDASGKDTFYAYATNSGQTMPCQRSADLVHWTALPDAMPQLAAWAKPDRTWAPNVVALVPGKQYVVYFTAWDSATNAQAVGAAVSTAPAGPFAAPAGAKPLIEQADLGGAIDPSAFVDTDGSRYLIWKNDGNSRGQDTWLWLQKLTADGLGLVGMPTKLIKEDQPWEGSLIEAPTLWKHGGKYYLFYSAGSYGGCGYAVGYAVSNSLEGPYTKPRTTPWLAATDTVCGPGGEDIVTARDGTTWMAYHSWAKGPNSYRSMSIDPLHWAGAVPVLVGPSRTPEPTPH